MGTHGVSTAVAVVFAGLVGIVQVSQQALAANTSANEVTVPQSALNSLIREPDRNFHRAADLYAEGDAQGAASEIRAAAALILIEAQRGSRQDATKLEKAVTDLDTLAGNIANGNVTSRQELDLAFGRADLALAAHYRSMAGTALANKDRANATRWLKAAGDSVDEAAFWSGESPSGAQAQVRDKMHALQAKIRTGANWSYDEAKKGVGYLGTQIQVLGQQMQNFGNSAAKHKAN